MRWRRCCLILGGWLLLSTPANAQDLIIRPVIGGLPADSGLALGVEVIHRRIVGSLDARVKAVGSVKRYEFLEVGLEFPEVGRWFYFELTGTYRNYPEEDFWGLGPDTLEHARMNYRLEDVDTTATFGASFDRFRAEISAGVVRINTGPGRDGDYPSVPPSLQVGPTLPHVGVLFEYESLDERSDPHNGAKYAFQWEVYTPEFHRFVMDLRRFVPISRTERLAFRAQTTFTHQSSSSDIPFFMLPIVGGTNTVRGFDQYRFRDRAALVLNAEYRRPLLAFLDAVVFVDAGRVYSHNRDISLRDLRTSGGIGARVKFGKRVFFGVDLAASHEGTHLRVRSTHMF
jgi:outer membrane protein assembly factor BamA